MKYMLTISAICITYLSQANFGGYYRYSTEGGGAILNSSNSQLIELIKEDISINLDQRVAFTATFLLKNTSNEEQELTLAFPQFSYWDIPYVSGSGYTPQEYYPLNEKLTINGNTVSFDEEMYSEKFVSSEQIKLKNRNSFSEQLIKYAGMNEAESPPSMPFVIWKLKKVTFSANETKTVRISFKRPWFFKDELWSFGSRTTGERSFEYIFETANTWKNSKISEFNMTINFPKDAWKNLNLDNEWFQKTSSTSVQVNKTDWSPSSSENLNLVWKSDYELSISDDRNCFNAIYYHDYSWRFGFDGSKVTSWCFTTSNMNCENFKLKPFDPLTKFSERVKVQPKRNLETRSAKKLFVINGFAKSQKLADQNAKPRTIQLTYVDIHDEIHKQNILLANSIAVQTFDLDKEAVVTKNFYLKVLDYYPGTKYQDVCIAEMWLE